MKNYIEAYDMLIAGKELFSDDNDYRVKILENMLDDKKIVPKKIAKNPDRYRKKKVKN